MGVIGTFVKWYLSRPDRYDIATLQDRARKRFGNVNVGNINREISSQLTERAYAIRARDFKGETQLSRLKLPGGKEQVRLVFTAKVYIPGSAGGPKTKYVTFTLDDQKKGTMGDLRDKAREMVKDWVAEKYQHDSTHRIRSIDFDFFGTF